MNMELFRGIMIPFLGTALGAKIRGIRPGKALDLFAAPACIFLCLARIAEAGMDTIGPDLVT